jgi:hypothetical protein
MKPIIRLIAKLNILSIIAPIASVLTPFSIYVSLFKVLLRALGA